MMGGTLCAASIRLHLGRLRTRVIYGEAPRQLDRFFGTFAPFARASESPMAIACFLLFTAPPFPPRPERRVPCLRRRIALRTDFAAAFPYLAIFIFLL